MIPNCCANQSGAWLVSAFSGFSGLHMRLSISSLCGRATKCCQRCKLGGQQQSPILLSRAFPYDPPYPHPISGLTLIDLHISKNFFNYQKTQANFSVAESIQPVALFTLSCGVGGVSGGDKGCQGCGKGDRG